MPLCFAVINLRPLCAVIRDSLSSNAEKTSQPTHSFHHFTSMVSFSAGCSRVISQEGFLPLFTNSRLSVLQYLPAMRPFHRILRNFLFAPLFLIKYIIAPFFINSILFLYTINIFHSHFLVIFTTGKSILKVRSFLQKALYTLFLRLFVFFSTSFRAIMI